IIAPLATLLYKAVNCQPPVRARRYQVWLCATLILSTQAGVSSDQTRIKVHLILEFNYTAQSGTLFDCLATAGPSQFLPRLLRALSLLSALCLCHLIHWRCSYVLQMAPTQRAHISASRNKSRIAVLGWR